MFSNVKKEKARLARDLDVYHFTSLTSLQGANVINYYNQSKNNCKLHKKNYF